VESVGAARTRLVRSSRAGVSPLPLPLHVLPSHPSSFDASLRRIVLYRLLLPTSVSRTESPGRKMHTANSPCRLHRPLKTAAVHAGRLPQSSEDLQEAGAGDGRKRRTDEKGPERDGKAARYSTRPTLQTISAMAQRSVSRDETIANFQAITGMDDLHACVELLEQHDWNLETAAAVALSRHDPYNPAGGGPASMAAAGPTRRAAAGRPRAQEDASRQDDSPRRDAAFSGAAPQRGVFAFFSRLLGGFGGGARRENDAQRFIELFNLEHGTVHPTPQVSTFREAVDKAKAEFKFLLVYLHSPNHQDTPTFLRETLCTEVCWRARACVWVGGCACVCACVSSW
jgi:hypothetical protein